MTYVEFPTDPLVGVHFKKKNGGTEPCGPLPDPVCQTYEGGAAGGRMPFIPGTYRTDQGYGENGVDGGIFQCFPPGPPGTPCPDTFTIGPNPDGNVAINALILEPNGAIVFTTLDLIFQPDGTQISWTVPIVEGDVCMTFGTDPVFNVPIPFVPESFTIDYDASILAAAHGDDYEWGMGLSHPFYDGSDNKNCQPPPGPNVAEGPTGSFTYDVDWFGWTWGLFHIDSGNQFDPSVGGPACIWFMARRQNSDGSFTAWEYYNTFLGPDDLWSVSASCIPEPSSRAAQRRTERLTGIYHTGGDLLTKPLGRIPARKEPNRRSRFR